MKVFSKRFFYALAALAKLTRSPGNAPLHITEIVASSDIPENYLVQILIELKKKGIIESIRGTNGGYILGRHPRDIAVIEILEILDGSIVTFEDTAGFPELSILGKEIKEKMERVLGLSLEELLRKTPVINYQI